MLDQVGRYRVKRRLGSGAFATVWLAEDDVLASSVAVKVLAENWSHQLDVRARFTQEAQIMRQADSDRLIRVLDIGELPDGRPYLVMTYAAGGTLADRLAAGPIPVEAAVRTAADIARGVAVLHDIGVIHRDLKPSNVLFTGPAPDGRVLIADLGLAKAIAHASGFTVIAGSPGYMAPEQAIPGGGLDVRSDVYAIGALVYHMLTGRPPTLATSVDAVPAAANAPVVRPSRLRRGIPARLDDVVLRALHPRPHRRWPSALALAEALESVVEACRVPGPGPAAGRRRRWPARVLAAAVTVVVAAATLAGSVAVPRTAPAWDRVNDVSHSISVAVPAAWAGQLRDAGWNPGAIRLPPGHAPGLLVGPDLDAWPDPTSEVPGVFAGLSSALRAGGPVPALPSHDRCVPQSERELVVGVLTARVRRWSRCGGAAISFSEALLTPKQGEYGIYLQIKQLGETDYTDEILRRLRLSSHPTPQADAGGLPG
jgi:hypothetical protein